MIILRRSELIKDLEAKIILHGENRDYWPDNIRKQIDDLVKSIFGINCYDTAIERRAGENDEDFAVRFDEYQETFETNYLEGYELFEYFKSLNLDFGSEFGTPLKCMEVVYQEAELAAKNIKGHLPNLDTDRERELENKLLKDLSIFKKARGK